MSFPTKKNKTQSDWVEQKAPVQKFCTYCVTNLWSHLVIDIVIHKHCIREKWRFMKSIGQLKWGNKKVGWRYTSFNKNAYKQLFLINQGIWSIFLPKNFKTLHSNFNICRNFQKIKMKLYILIIIKKSLSFFFVLLVNYLLTRFILRQVIWSKTL